MYIKEANHDFTTIEFKAEEIIAIERALEVLDNTLDGLHEDEINLEYPFTEAQLKNMRNRLFSLITCFYADPAGY